MDITIPIEAFGPLLIIPIFLINIIICLAITRNYNLNKIQKISVAFVHSLMIFLFVVLFLNKTPGYFTETIELYQKIKNLTPKSASKGDNYIKDNFILINTSHTNSLIPFEGGDSENDCSNTKITSRKKLTDLLTTLIEDTSDIDLVVCDIIFPEAGLNDTIDNNLSLAIGTLAREDKIVVAQSLTENAKPFQFNNNIQGNVNIDEQEHNIIKVPLFYNNTPTLSYKMYCMINKVAYSRSWLPIVNENGTLVYDEIIPTMPFTNEARIYEVKDGISDVNETVFLKDLGDVTTQGGKDLLLWTLKNRKKENKRNIILIGEFPVFPFSDSGQDVHNTPYGKLYGSTIIMNLFYEFERGHHKVKWWQLLFLWGTIYLLSIRAINKQEEGNNLKHEQNISKRMRILIMERLYDEFLFIVLAIATAISIIIFNQPINIMVLGIYFYLFQKLFAALTHKHENKN